jgi:hypothetical protein
MCFSSTKCRSKGIAEVILGLINIIFELPVITVAGRVLSVAGLDKPVDNFELLHINKQKQALCSRGDDSIATAVLGVVERLVGLFQQLLR